MTTTAQIKSIEELDALLDRYASDPEGFEDKARRRAQAWNRSGFDLELREPSSWRQAVDRPAPTGVSSIEEQLRSEIDALTIMDREEEARHARRIEFARLRLEHARTKAGFTEEQLAGCVHYDPTTYRAIEGSCDLPAGLSRRWVELHHLRTELVERNLYLVLINVERYAHSGINRADLIQEGSAALFRAVDGFDWRRGLLFRTYAVHWLNQAFRNYLYNFSNTVRVPVYLQKALKQINQAQVRLGDPNASAEQIAEITELTEGLVSSALGAARSAFSLDADFGGEDGDGNRLRDLLTEEADDDGPYTTRLEDISLSAGLEGALGKLSDREQFVVRKRFGLGFPREHTLAEVAAELGVSVERVRQIQVRAISKLDTPALRRDLDPFLN